VILDKYCTRRKGELALKALSSAILIALLIPLKNGFSADLPANIDSDRPLRHQSRILIPLLRETPAFFLNRELSESGSDRSDIKISESISPATFRQDNSSAVRLGQDRFVIVWQDLRLGSYKIFAQILDSSGSVLGGNHLLLGRSDGYDLIEPKVVSNGAGGFYLGFRDVISGKIFVAGYDSDLNQIMAPVVINDNPPGNYAGPFDIDSYQNLRFVVVWENYGIGNTIALRLFGANGQPLMAQPLTVNDDPDTLPHWVPSVAMNQYGAMGVVWEDYRKGNADIFFQMVNADGTAYGANLGLVKAAADDSAQYLPEIAFSSRDGFAVGWLDKRSGYLKAYIQRIVPGIGLVDTNFTVSDPDSLVQDWQVAMAVDSSHDLDLARAAASDVGRILLQKFTDGFIPEGIPDTINSFTAGFRWQPALAVGISDKIICSWTDYRSGNEDIFLELLSPSGHPLLPEDKLVNDDTAGAESVEPAATAVDGINDAVVFADARNDIGDIFLQLVNSAGILTTPNLKVNADNGTFLQEQPAIASSAMRLFIVWIDGRPILGKTGTRIFGRFADHNGSFIGGDFVISDSDNVAAKNCPAVGMMPDGNALVVWANSYSGSVQVYGRHYNPDGSPSNDPFIVSSPGIDLDNDDIHIDIDQNGFFTVVWKAVSSAGRPKVVAARFTSSGEFVDRFDFPGDNPDVLITDIAAAVNDQGDVYLLWEGCDLETWLYITVFSGSGTIIVPTFAVTSESSGAAYDPDLAVDNDGFVIVSWVNSLSGKRRIYSRIFDNSLIPCAADIPVSPETAEFAVSPRVAADGKVARYVWSQSDADGRSIYLNQYSYAWVDADENHHPTIPANFALGQNYPNPFNSSTRFEFAVPSRSRITITIYNILGRSVRLLADRTYDAGMHTASWDGTDDAGREVASGIYFYTMKAGNLEFSKKMFLIK
jgi:hypothetical protein